MNFLTKTGLAVAALSLLGAAAVTPARAQVGAFNFEGDASGTLTTFSDVSGGITATFSSPSDPGGFGVYANPAVGSVLLSGQVLGDGFGLATGQNIPLTIAFSQNLSALTLDFVDASAVMPGPQTFTLEAFENGTSVGTLTVPGSVLASGFNAEGVIGFFAPAFNSVQLHSATANTGWFAIDNLNVVAAPAVPEASTTVSFGLLLALGLGGLVVAAKKRKQAA